MIGNYSFEVVLVVVLFYWGKKIMEDIKWSKKFTTGDYVCTMCEGQFVRGSVLEFTKNKYIVKLDDGRKITVPINCYIVKENPLKY